MLAYQKFAVSYFTAEIKKVSNGTKRPARLMDNGKTIEEVVLQSGLPEQSCKHRFNKATNHAPIVFMQIYVVKRL